MRALAMAAASALLATAVSASAQASAPNGTTEAAPVEKKICRTYQKTGSIMPGKRTCHTKQEWSTLDAQQAVNVEDKARRHLSTSPGGM